MPLARFLAPLPLLLAAAVHPTWGQEPPVTESAPEVAAPEGTEGVEVTYLANAGFHLRSGAYSVLIDAFVRDPVSSYAALTPELHKQLVAAAPPFEGITAVLVSHNHADHVQLRSLERYLKANPEALLMTSSQVARALKETARDYPSIQRQVSPVRAVPGTPTRLEQQAVAIEFLALTHAGNQKEEIVNLGHLIEMGGLRILHVGDAAPSALNFTAYHLAEKAIDLAIVPYWFLGSPEALQTLEQEIHPRSVIACHVPPGDWEKVKELVDQELPGVILFRESLESRTFLPRGLRDGSAAPGATGDEDGD